MSQKVVEIERLGNVVLQKRRGAKNLRLSVSSSGVIKVSMPLWSPYSAGITFVKSKINWITAHRQSTNPIIFFEGARIGKSHRLLYINNAKYSKISDNLISIPLDYSDIKIEQACEKALKKQAEALLPQRLSLLASQFGFSYKQLIIKKMRSRWGSCSNKKTINLNIFLMQLPWDLIDYVLLHELVHTKHLNHSAEFWKTMDQVYPNTKNAKLTLKNYSTHIIPSE